MNLKYREASTLSLSFHNKEIRRWKPSLKPCWRKKPAPCGPKWTRGARTPSCLEPRYARQPPPVGQELFPPLSLFFFFNFILIFLKKSGWQIKRLMDTCFSFTGSLNRSRCTGEMGVVTDGRLGPADLTLRRSLFTAPFLPDPSVFTGLTGWLPLWRPRVWYVDGLVWILHHHTQHEEPSKNL